MNLDKVSETIVRHRYLFLSLLGTLLYVAFIGLRVDHADATSESISLDSDGRATVVAQALGVLTLEAEARDVSGNVTFRTITLVVVSTSGGPTGRREPRASTTRRGAGRRMRA